MRNTVSLSCSEVISGEVLEGVTMAMPAGMVTELAAASTAPEQCGPTMATTPSMLTALVAASVAFCDRLGMNYVSCSPFRVPIARLAAAQSALASRGTMDRTRATV